jgi:hypothetical protein
MNTYYSSRSTRPAWLFSFGLLDGPHVRLRRPHLGEAHGKGASRGLRTGEKRLGGRLKLKGFGLSRFAPAFMNSPG